MKTISAIVFIIFLLLFPFTSIEATSSYYKYNNNPVLNLSPSGWDSKAIFRPNVIHDGINYKMYYAGSDGNKFQIGLATSQSGLSWTKHPNNPVIALPPNIDNLYDPIVIKTSSGYTMWYETQAKTGTLAGFHFYRALSDDGINWTTNPTNPIIFQAGGYSPESNVTPSIIYEKNLNIYKMWYSTLQAGIWSISYAESADGITWLSDSRNPIITGNQSWEGAHVTGPTVLYDNGIYHIWYRTSPNNAIVYAYSPNGITGWVKPGSPINPIIQPDQNTFDGGFIDDGTVLKIGNNYMLWYGAHSLAVLDFIDYKIGLASNLPILPDVEPTPEPPKVNKIIFIPGLAGSWNLDAIMRCKSDSYIGSWSAMPKTDLIFNPLLDAINATDSKILPFYYDWRRDPRDSAEKLKIFIDSNTITNEKVYLVGYSLGGLVGRAYIEKYKDSKIAKYITVGTPFEGALDAYPAWEGDKIVSDNKQWKYFANIVIHFCRNKNSKSKTIIKDNMPSIQSLLPTFDYLRNWKTHMLQPINTMLTKNNWLPNNDFNSPFYNIPFKSIIGIGQKTTDELYVKQPNKWDILSKIWRDGEIIGKTHQTKDGDGTVLTKSATIKEADTTQINKDHTALISSSDTIQTIKDFFGLSSTNNKSLSISETNSSENYNPDSALIIIGDPGFSIQLENNQIIEDTDGLIYLPNLKKGEYNLRLIRKQIKNMKLHVFQFNSNGEKSHKEYNLDRNRDNHKIIRWNREKPSDNLISD